MGAYGIWSVCVAWSISVSNQAVISPSSKTSVFSFGGSSPRRFLPFCGQREQVPDAWGVSCKRPWWKMTLLSRTLLYTLDVTCSDRVTMPLQGPKIPRLVRSQPAPACSLTFSHLPRVCCLIKAAAPPPCQRQAWHPVRVHDDAGTTSVHAQGVLNGVAPCPLWWISKKDLHSSPIWSCGPSRMKRKINVWWKNTNVNGERAALEIRTRPG